MSLDSGGKERVCTLVHQLDQPYPITSLHFECTAEGGRMFAMWCTSSPTRMYHCYRPVQAAAAAAKQPSSSAGSTAAAAAAAGGGNSSSSSGSTSPLHSFFSSYSQNHSGAFMELPGGIDRARLQLYGKPLQRTQSFAILTQFGVYHGSILLTSSQGR